MSNVFMKSIFEHVYLIQFKSIFSNTVTTTVGIMQINTHHKSYKSKYFLGVQDRPAGTVYEKRISIHSDRP